MGVWGRLTLLEVLDDMRIHLAWLLLLVLASPAHAEIWECDEGGIKRFTNIKAEAKGCKLLVVAPPNTVSPPKGAQPKGASVPAKTPESFPRVDTETQKQRDNDRRRILDQELANEQKLLDQARKELAEQESQRLGSERNYQRVLERLEPYRKKVKLHEDNVANLRRELAGTK
jgi:hypothetical protein